jgi:hypothetical protein
VQNVEFYRQLRRGMPTQRDWALTVLFYVAVHDVKAFFVVNRAHFASQGGKLPQSHWDVKGALRANPKWRTLGGLYESFFALSRRTRYGCWMPSEGDLAKSPQVAPIDSSGDKKALGPAQPVATPVVRS